MNRAIWIVLVLIVIAGAIYFFVRSSNTGNTAYLPSSSTSPDQQVLPGSTESPSPETSSSPSANEPTITIENMAFSPITLTVSAGAEVFVTNNDGIAHTVTSNDGVSFDTGTINPGTTTSFTAPSQPGTYAFHCTIHPTTMKGILIVK